MEILNNTTTKIPDWLYRKIMYHSQIFGSETFHSYSRRKNITFCYDLFVDENKIVITNFYKKDGKHKNDFYIVRELQNKKFNSKKIDISKFVIICNICRNVRKMKINENSLYCEKHDEKVSINRDMIDLIVEKLKERNNTFDICYENDKHMITSSFKIINDFLYLKDHKVEEISVDENPFSGLFQNI